MILELVRRAEARVERWQGRYEVAQQIYHEKMLVYRKVERHLVDVHSTQLLRKNGLMKAEYCTAGEGPEQPMELPPYLQARASELCREKEGCGSPGCRARPRGAASASQLIREPNTEYMFIIEPPLPE